MSSRYIPPAMATENVEFSAFAIDRRLDRLPFKSCCFVSRWSVVVLLLVLRWLACFTVFLDTKTISSEHRLP